VKVAGWLYMKIKVKSSLRKAVGTITGAYAWGAHCTSEIKCRCPLTLKAYKILLKLMAKAAYCVF